MGETYLIANLDKKQIIKPESFNESNRVILNKDYSSYALFALHYLIKRGGETEEKDETFSGKWAGDRILILGDYSKMKVPKDLSEKITEEDIYRWYAENYNEGKYPEEEEKKDAIDTYKGGMDLIEYIYMQSFEDISKKLIQSLSLVRG